MRRLLKLFLGILIVLISLPLTLHISSEIIIASLTRQAQDTDLFAVSTMEVGGVMWAFRDYNSEAERVLVIVHGFMGSSYDFHLLSTELNEELDVRIIAVDLPGFGQSDKTLDYLYTSHNHAVQLGLFLEQLEVHSYTLAGHSMGGDVVIRHSALFPTQVERLILIAAAGLDGGGAAEALSIAFYDYIFTNYWAQRFGVNTATSNNLTRSQFHPYIIQNAAIPGATIQKFSLNRDTGGNAALLADISMPTLILYGDEDSWTPPSLGERLHEGISDSTFILLEGLGHLPYLEDIATFKSPILNFLSE